MSSISKPHQIIRTQPLCPVCGKTTYSKGGIHPQCAVARADASTAKARKAKAAAKPKAPRSSWSKRCPRCSREVAARRHTCDCGHQFPQSASS